MCYAQGAKLNSEEGKFQLDCSLRELSQEDLDRGLLPLAQLPGYWYETGPANIFRQAIDVREPVSGSNESTEGTEAELQTRDEPGGEGNATSAVAPPKNILLLKREGEGNPWHCLMEIFSAYMTFDVLRMSAVPGSEGNKPLFTDAGDSDDTQVVILDEREDGPYFDLWTLFARRKPLRLRELLSDPVSSAHLSNVNLVVPLAGSSNPFWQGDEKSMQCNESPILEVFVRRVLDFYAIPDPPFRTTNQDPIAVTFVQRSETRRLHNQRSLFAELQRRNPRVRVQMVDFAAMSFSEQVRIARQTDVLVGVHGAGLTHSMFMRKGAGAVVEIQPRGLDHNGFRNVAGKLGLGYFRTHVDIVPLDEWEEEDEEASADHEGAPPQDRARTIPGASRTRQRRTIEARDEWHTADVVIDEDRFFRVVEPAVEFMYTKGPWDYDTD
ncbi:hypothetical protein F4778DRAFT_747202 [Xylariomycetidae sp. FL2044]|nr:hypothetical protein F4778DRAFT_747202 [Xylariomycetidae sp. FL2044]